MVLEPGLRVAGSPRGRYPGRHRRRVIAAAFHIFVRLYEEPTLDRAYGQEYAAYRDATPRWIPRFRR